MDPPCRDSRSAGSGVRIDLWLRFCLGCDDLHGRSSFRIDASLGSAADTGGVPCYSFALVDHETWRTVPHLSMVTVALLAREVPLSHDDDAWATGGPSDGGEAPSGAGVRQPDPGSVAPVARDSREALPAGPGPGSLGHRRQRYDASHEVRWEDDQEPVLVSAADVKEVVRLELQRAWSGPLPPPETLAQYEAILPGSAERILAMAETAAIGEIRTSDKLADAEIVAGRQGLALAATLTLIAFVAAIVFFAVGAPIAGGLFLSFPV